MDILSDVLENLQLKGSVHFNTCFNAPWGVAVGPSEQAAFHIIERGRGWLQLEGEKEGIDLQAGDIVIVLHGCQHKISDRPDSKGIAGETVVGKVTSGENPFKANDGDETNIICGYFDFNHDTHQPLLHTLPRCIHLTREARSQFIGLEHILTLMVEESTNERQGKTLLLNKITEILFVQAVRAYIYQNRETIPFFMALTDKRLINALSLIHKQPEAPWSVDLLAKTVGMSRTSFSNKFHQATGVTPMKYITIQRMERAKQKIQNTTLSLGVIADEVGYHSESAFKKGFKKLFGASPSTFRR